MARLDLVDSEQLAELNEVLELAIALNKALSSGKYSPLWLCIETLNEMGILSKDEFLALTEYLRGFSDEASDVHSFIQQALPHIDM